MSPRPQRGATLAIILVVLALVMLAFMATYALSRFTGAGDDRDKTKVRLQLAADALDQFAATARRLPCPANPQATAATENGLEVPDPANPKGCAHPTGVLPWQSIGLRREDAYDGWGRRLSYRVFTGSPGTYKYSLTQARGVDMTECDTVEPVPPGETDADGLCVSSTVPTDRTTSESRFLSLHGMTVWDMGNSRGDVAYVVISHGATGGGAYTASGARVEMPTGDQRKNTETGPFYIRAFSDVETPAKQAGHFDDMLVYRPLAELVKRAGLMARDWPDPPPLAGAIRLDVASVTAGAAAVGATVSGTDTGTYLLDMEGAYLIGVSGGNLTNISIDTVNSTSGVGVVGGTNTKMSFAEGEWLAVLFDNEGTQFSLTVNDFGTYSIGTRTYTETLRLYFADGNGAMIGTYVTKSACRADGGLATFTVNVGVPYRWVYILPWAAPASSGFPGDTAMLLSEIRTCPSTEPSCKTSLWSAGNECP